MISLEEFINDDRFYIDDWNARRIFNAPVRAYEITTIPVGKIVRIQNGKIIGLDQTEVFNYLLDPANNESEYARYCTSMCPSNMNRSVEQFDKLIGSFSGGLYSLKKGAIVVDQLNIILEGQHRSCILLKNNGPDFSIDVVKLHYAQLKLRTRFKILKYRFNMKKYNHKNKVV